MKPGKEIGLALSHQRLCCGRAQTLGNVLPRPSSGAQLSHVERSYTEAQQTSDFGTSAFIVATVKQLSLTLETTSLRSVSI